MALTLLDGTNANIDFAVAVSGSNTTSFKCAFGYMSADMVREMSEKTTFCSEGWRARQPGMKQLVGHLDGFVSSGAVYSDPTIMMSTTTPLAFVFTADTSCTLTGDLHVVRDHMGLRAASNSDRGIDWESSGPVTSAWVVA
jgi:hypothetical protein